jgi:hypothetical protein
MTTNASKASAEKQNDRPKKFIILRGLGAAAEETRREILFEISVLKRLMFYGRLHCPG